MWGENGYERGKIRENSERKKVENKWRKPKGYEWEKRGRTNVRNKEKKVEENSD